MIKPDPLAEDPDNPLWKSHNLTLLYDDTPWDAQCTDCGKKFMALGGSLSHILNSLCVPPRPAPEYRELRFLDGTPSQKILIRG